MGRSHALSGGVGWLGGCAALVAVGQPPSGRAAVVGAVVSAGFALLPDIDHPQSTIARTLGPATRVAAKVVAFGASRLRKSSCDHCERRPSRGGHRAATHTAAAALTLGGILSLAALLAGAKVGLAVVWVAVGLAARAMLTRRQRGTFGAVLLATMVTAAVGVVVPPGYGWWWIGLPVAWGCLAHDLGDSITVSGAPLAWPLRINGCRWYPLGSPQWLRFRTGSFAEQIVFAALAIAGVFGSGYILAAG